MATKKQRKATDHVALVDKRKVERRANYTRKKIVIAITDIDSTEIWKCPKCKRWHSLDGNGCDDDHPDLCDECAFDEKLKAMDKEQADKS